MNVELKPGIAAIVHAQVASGEFATAADAVAAAVLGIGVDEPGDAAWAKPYLEKGLADLAAGRTLTADAVHAELRAKFGPAQE